MSNAYAEWFAKIEREHGEQLADMPLPEGLPEYLDSLVAAGDREAILFMIKVAWQLGAQTGISAGMHLVRQGAGAKGGAPAGQSGSLKA